MQSNQLALILTTSEPPVLAALDAWLVETGLSPLVVGSPNELLSVCLRGRPRVVVVDARSDMAVAAEACGRLKADSYTGVVPTIVICTPGNGDMERCFAAGADEVLTEATPEAESRSRLNAVLAI